MLRKMVMICILCVLAGCATASVPLYLAQGRSSPQRFYTDHARAVEAVRQALKEAGWVLEREEDPRVYEVMPEQQGSGEQLLLMTSIREKKTVFFARQERVNVVVLSRGSISDIEIRSLAVQRIGPVRFKRSGGKRSAQQFFESVERILAENR